MDSMSGVGFTEFDVRRIVPGDVESVRRRLADVLEEFNFRVLNEQPLQARRSQQRNIIAANTLEMSAKLTIGLKQQSPTTTLVTFDYTVQQLWTKGDRQTFEREVDAIIALALMRTLETFCPACGAETRSDSRFCRSCGAPAAFEALPAELEVMRLTAGARGAHQEVSFGVAVSLLTLAFTLPLILLGRPKGVALGLVILFVGQLIGLLTLFYGMWRLHRTLNPKQSALPAKAADEVPRVVAPPPQLVGSSAPALPPRSAGWSTVTEGTTELLQRPREQAAVPLKGEREDTGRLA